MTEPENNAAGLPEVEQGPHPVAFSRTMILTSLAASMALLFVFAWLAEEVFEGEAAGFDAAVRAWVHSFASPPLTAAMRFCSALGSPVLIAGVIVSIVVFLVLHWKRAALWMVVDIAGAGVLDLTLKNGFHRPRPVPFFGSVPHSYSFPSGHALFSFCFYLVLAGLVTARIRSQGLRIAIWVLAALVVAAIGLSRIYLGVHYPSDVLAGYLSAAVWVTAMITADRARRRER